MPDPDDLLATGVTRWRHHFARRLDPRDPADAEQELILALLEALPGYRPERGPLGAYGYAVMRRRHARLRGRAARGGRHERRGERLHIAADPRPARERDADLRLDVAEAIARLDPGLARLADALTRLTLAEVARAWGVPRTTLQRRVEKLRAAFDGLRDGGGP